MTLEIANVSNTPVLLYPGRLIGQLVLMDVERELGEGKLGSTYFGPVYPEGPAFDSPQEDLRKIGVRRTSILVRKWSDDRLGCDLPIVSGR